MRIGLTTKTNKQFGLLEKQCSGKVRGVCVLHNDFGITVQDFNECDQLVKFPWMVSNLEWGNEDFPTGAQEGNGGLAFGNIDVDSVHKCPL